VDEDSADESAPDADAPDADAPDADAPDADALDEASLDQSTPGEGVPGEGAPGEGAPGEGAPGESKRKLPTGAIVAGVFVVTILLLGGVALALRGLAAGPLPGSVTASGHSGAVAFACIQVNDQNSDDYCGRLAKDYFARRRLSPEQQAALADEARQVQNAIVVPHHPYTTCMSGPDAPCAYRNPAPTALDVVSVRAALTAAGYSPVVARLARPDDPAPAGALIYAVPVPPGCLVGYISGGGSFSGGAIPIGTYPDGTCLHP
jgi:hypothetical protein